MPNYSDVLDGAFGALASPVRRRVLVELASGPAAVTELARPFDMALPSFLRHVTLLEDAGCVATEKTGRVRTCRLLPAPLERAQGWLGEQRAVWEARTDRLERFLREEDR
ncbi:ArsR/SmtB family transcription factor [Pseudonocardia endophytica]|uniref:ArsR family transcriptional regulator n=1 Tax=Pseudonocardia endophytica TaxID=401976 RepID=A0A4R1HMK6_PSEEN|nr:metalloregulator ArsR/SmtB family transcription factor [Pseudonocardia endophytica]TCK22381.1 ArsR family transcriptional regulator [Pseudonocardia endophytica]